MFGKPYVTAGRGLDRSLFVYRLWQKAKMLGTWDPEAIDFSQDRSDWDALDEAERQVLIGIAARFLTAEEAVTYDLLPLMLYVARERRVEEEMFLTAFLWEEAKHVEGFSLFFENVVRAPVSMEDRHGPYYRQFFYDELPAALDRLLHDPTPEHLAEAVVTYQMVGEGVVGETGYRQYHEVLTKRDVMPGLQRFIFLVQQDEARHIAFGVYLLSRLIAEHGEPLWKVIRDRMEYSSKVASRLLVEGYTALPGQRPFEIDPFKLINFAFSQYQKRLHRIEKARRQTLDEILYAERVEELDLTETGPTGRTNRTLKTAPDTAGRPVPQAYPEEDAHG